MLIVVLRKRIGFLLAWAIVAGMVWIIVCRIPFIEVTGLFPTALHDRVIVLDPGHGGVDPGAHYKGQILEKDLVLEIAKKTGQFLTNAGAEVIMTRTDDRDLAPPEIKSLAERKRRDLRARVELANQAKADLFLSIHINSSRDPSKSGVEVYYSSKPGSKDLAELIEKESLRYIGKKRLPLPGRYFVLRETSMPAVLIEVGFISNPQEKKLLADKRYQERLGWVIFQGALHYFEQSRFKILLNSLK
ncbi:MAG: N-acetylmuramoyl-L-alanine amidase [Firmicutes bacterium]|nr:N-acetylmuramoyl-L-alanine amidase [Bacillota bacterium]